MSRTRTVRRTTVVAAPPSRVFEALTSPEVVPLVDPSVRSWVPHSEPVGVGTRFSIRGRMGRLPFRATSEVTAWDPPGHAAFRAVRPAWPLTIAADHRCDGGDGEGPTTYTWTITLTGPGPAVALAARLFRGVQARQAAALGAHGWRGTNR